jgi:hypothetical protein
MRTIHAIESGTGTGAASCVTMARLADALHVTRGWLAFGGWSGAVHLSNWAGFGLFPDSLD